MTPRPRAVVAHFLVLRATPGAARASAYREAAQIRLMVKPAQFPTGLLAYERNKFSF